MTNSSHEPSTQQLLTALVQATSELAQSNKQQNLKLDALTDQVGRLTEGITDLKLTVDEGFKQLDARLNQIASTAEQQAETAKQQAESITRLISMLEKK